MTEKIESVSVELIEPHEHKRVLMQPGDIIQLRTNQADSLIKQRIAKHTQEPELVGGCDEF